MTSSGDGTFSVAAPRGSYLVYAQPLTGFIQPGNLYLTTAGTVDTNFQPAFLPGTVTVTTGNATDASFAVQPAAGAGPALQYVAIGQPGGMFDGTIFGASGALQVPSGQPFDFEMAGPGLDETLQESNIQWLGPVTMIPGSLRTDGHVTFNDGTRIIVMRMSLTSQSVTAPATATLIVNVNGAFTAYTGGVLLMP